MVLQREIVFWLQQFLQLLRALGFVASSGNGLGVSAHRSGVGGQKKGNTDGSSGAETELHSQSSEDKHSPVGDFSV